jgi:hypothetical protein
VPLCLCSAGCGPQAEYRVATNRPWPDEYTPPGRAAESATLLLTPPIVQWHARMDPVALCGDARAKAGGHGSVYLFTRRTMATRVGGGPGPERIWIVEARLGKRYLVGGLGGRGGPSGTMPLSDAVAAYSHDLGVSIQIASSVNANMQVAAPRGTRDPRDSFVRMLAARDLFVAEWEYLPLTVRSYEYASRDAFLDAVASVTDTLAGRPSPATLTIVPAATWLAPARRAQEDVLEELAKRLKGRRRIGDFMTSEALPTPTMLSDDEAAALRQAAFAVPAQVAPGVEATH